MTKSLTAFAVRMLSIHVLLFTDSDIPRVGNGDQISRHLLPQLLQANIQTRRHRQHPHIDEPTYNRHVLRRINQMYVLLTDPIHSLTTRIHAGSLEFGKYIVPQ